MGWQPHHLRFAKKKLWCGLQLEVVIYILWFAALFEAADSRPIFRINSAKGRDFVGWFLVMSFVCACVFGGRFLYVFWLLHSKLPQKEIINRETLILCSYDFGLSDKFIVFDPQFSTRSQIAIFSQNLQVARKLFCKRLSESQSGWFRPMFFGFPMCFSGSNIYSRETHAFCS